MELKLNKTYFVLIGGLKGGIGKSVVTRYLANYLYHNTDLTVAVLDGDDDQRTIDSQRKKEIAVMLETKEIIHEDEADCFDCIHLPSKDIASTYVDAIDGEYDVVFADLPGNMKQRGVKSIYLMADIIYMPIGTAEDKLDSTKKFIDFLKNEIIPTREANDLKTLLRWFFNDVKTNLLEFKEYNTTDDLKNLFGVERLDNFFPDSSVWSERTISTIHNERYIDERKKLPPYLTGLMEEMYQNIIKFNEGKIL